MVGQDKLRTVVRWFVFAIYAALVLMCGIGAVYSTAQRMWVGVALFGLGAAYGGWRASFPLRRRSAFGFSGLYDKKDTD